MINAQLLSPEAPKEIQLRALSKEITGLHEIVSIRLKRIMDYGRDCMTDAIVCGNHLLMAKGRMNHGEWMPWLSENCQTLPYKNANQYMKLAKWFRDKPQIYDAGCIKRALMICGENDEGEKTQEGEPIDPFVKVAKRFDAIASLIESFPVNSWSEDGREKIRGEMEPIARQLWPEKFDGKSGGIIEV